MFERLIELLTGKCRFHKKCEHYQKSAFTCNHDAGPYCGKYRDLRLREAGKVIDY